MDKITFCIPSKSNLRYLKTCIPSIRDNAYRKDHDIIVFVDSDEDGTIEWLDQVKEQYNVVFYVNPDLGKHLYGIGKAYDYCIEKSTTDVFMIFHADMMLGKHADLKAYQHLSPNTVVCATRVEPPLHPNAGEKILIDFGLWPEEWKRDEFNSFVKTQLDSTKVTNGIFAPWMMFKEDFLRIGGHDPALKSCREDSDVFNRMKLAGYKFVQPWNSLVYHLTGRGAGSFEGDQQRHEAWQREMVNSTKEFIRKWGSGVKHTDLLEPIITPKYDIGFIVHNCNEQLLNALEPWCNTIYIDCSPDAYIWQEQPNTLYDLLDRIQDISITKHNNILVTIDGKTFSQNDMFMIEMLAAIIQQTNEIGEFELGNLKIQIDRLTTFEHGNIVCEYNIYNK
jgi:glycosyltransferase involved in cell wall biosynthesis